MIEPQRGRSPALRHVAEAFGEVDVVAIGEDGSVRSARQGFCGALVAAIALAGCATGPTASSGRSGTPTSFEGSGPDGPRAPSGAFRARVARVVDGDTFVATNGGGGQVRVRLIGVNAPEIAHDGAPAECFGPEATEFLRRLIEGTTITAAYESGGQRDKYGRDLWDVWSADGRFVQRELVATGAARARGYRPQLQFADYLSGVEAAARSSNVGLWGRC